MYLKRIELENFKSFKGEVVIPFIRGFTAITGPNGSGKSNCGDAIQFVQATSSNKNIRADNVRDLIFNGGGTGRPAKSCIVSLVFDNPKDADGRRRMSIETDEVKFTRQVRITRGNNTVSEYKVNDEASSRNHFRILLAEANASADGYNIVLQGDVTNLARMTSGNRRKVMDKVAGVTAYDDEIRKATSQRVKVDETMERIDLMQAELSSQLKELKKEREQALKAKELIEELSKAKVILLHSKHRSRFDEIQFLSEEQGRYNEESRELRKIVQDGAKELLDLDDLVADIERQIAEVLGEDSTALMDRINKLHRDCDRRKDNITDAETQIEESEEDIEVLLAEEAEASSALNEHSTELADAQNAMKAAEAALKDAEKAEKKARDALLAGDKNTHQLTRALGKAGEAVHTKQKALADSQLEKDRAAQHVELTAGQLAEAQEQVTECQLGVDDLKLEGEELGENDPEEGRAKLGKELLVLQRSEAKLAEEAQLVETKLRESQRNLVMKRTEYEGVTGGRGGHIAAVQHVLELRDTGQRKGIIGTISELCRPLEDSHELALATVIGPGGMSAIVVETDEVASECMRWLRENKIGRAMFLPLNQMQSFRAGGKARMIQRQPGVVGFASELLEYDPRFTDAVHYVVRDTLVVNDLATARRHMGGVRLVTVRGDVTERGGAMQGGAPMKVKTGFGGKLAGASELDKLQAEVDKMRLMSETVNKALQEAREQQRLLRERLNALTNDDASLRIVQWREELRLAESRLSKAKGIVKEFEGRLTAAEKGLKAKEDNLAAAILGLTNAESDRNEASETLQVASPEHLQKMLREAQDLRASAELQKAQASGTLVGGEGHGHIFVERVKELSTRRNKLVEDNTTRTGKIAQWEKEILELQKELSDAQTAHSLVTEEHQELDDSRMRATEDRAALRATLQAKAAQAETLETRANDLTMQIQQKRIDLAALVEEMAEQEVEIPGVEANLPPVGEAEKVVNRIQRKVDSFGPINMLAIEKYDATAGRVDDLKRDNKILSTRRKELVEIAERLEKQRKKRLLAVLKEVDSNFRIVYKDLSGGGRGELFLENPEEPFKGGLSMWAQPLGKSSKVKLEQLSGGEQSIASLALIFAIQDYDPSPFYYFDEVDQNLDPINAERIATMCRHRSERAQFIQVTLRKVSLQLADHHIGITHAGDGCSRRIANFDRDRAIELGAKALAELKEGKEEKERQGVLDRLGELPNPEEMPQVPDELPDPESLGGIDEESEAESEAETEVETEAGFGSLRERTEDLSEDIEEEQELQRQIGELESEETDSEQESPRAGLDLDLDLGLDDSSEENE